jgi:hypothetical protein
MRSSVYLPVGLNLRPHKNSKFGTDDTPVRMTRQLERPRRHVFLLHTFRDPKIADVDTSEFDAKIKRGTISLG